MACFHPLPAWYARRVNPSGKRGITFSLADGFKDKPLQVPCGKCVGCRLEYARQWAVRCMHESRLYDSNSFVTLTYSDDELPYSKSGVPTLRPRDFTLFMKRLRLEFPDTRYFQCGEYGENTLRPHHHALLFNLDFPDKRKHSGGGASPVLYVSKTLERLWPYGHASIGAVTFESAGYVARYNLKGVKESPVPGVVPSYLTMSRRPGIGYEWAMRYRKDYYRDDCVIVNGVETRPPRYYDSIEEREAPSVLRRVKSKRRREAAEDPNNTGARLNVREEVKKASISLLNRSI